MKQRFFNIAKVASQKSVHHTAKIGAVVVKRGNIISIGFNQLKTHTKSLHPHFMIHAEFDSIIGCSKEDLENSDIYVYREHKDGSLACSKPCESCQRLIVSAGIKNVYYTDNDKFCKL